MSIMSFSPFGYEGALVTVEVDLRRGIPAIDLVGLADNSVKEARERMRAAIRNSGYEFPPERVLISLSPADVKKEGAGFDLPIALAVLMESIKNEEQENLELIPPDDTQLEVLSENDKENKRRINQSKILVMGELELSGKIRSVRGVHAAVSTAIENGITQCIIPVQNVKEATGHKGIKVCAVENLKEAYNAAKILSAQQNDIFSYGSETKLNGDDNSDEVGITRIEFPPVEQDCDFADIKGQPFFIRGLQIAAAGRHNLLVYGGPGCGKTLALQRYISLLPYLSQEDAQPVTRIYSLAGFMPNSQELIRNPPFRMPHQSASLEGMIGGGPHCRPGEVSLAHNGVLFLDEASEFRTSVLQALRVPLEQKKVTLSRAGRYTVYPSDFQLMIATNPCPCGNYGSENKICVCGAHAIEQFWKKFSSPLLDRIDIRVFLQQDSLSLVKDSSESCVSSEQLRKEIKTAMDIQYARQGKLNSHLIPEEIDEYCILNDECKDYIKVQIERNSYSSRAVHSCLKLARTIADMKESVNIQKQDLIEAFQYRQSEGGVNICL